MPRWRRNRATPAHHAPRDDQSHNFEALMLNIAGPN
jgi:hypothetical protein